MSKSLHQASSKSWVIAALLVGAPAVAAEPAAPEPAAAPPKPPYSLPFGLRPAVASTVIRSDTAIAPADKGTTVASLLLGGAEVAPDLGVYGRWGWVQVSPDEGDSASAFTNPMVLGLYTPKVGPLRLPIFAGVALPFGQGGGAPADRDADAYGAAAAGIYGRAALDNALFAVNYLTPAVGAGVAWIADGLTVQAEVTVLQLFQARGGSAEKDESRTNFTTGLHAGYAVLGPQLILSLEARAQRWLSTPAAVEKRGVLREQVTAGGGVRTQLALGPVKVRPGVAFFAPLDAPMTTAGAKIVQIDVPVIF